MKKRFPEWNEEPVQEFKCAMNDRTNRGSLVITPSGLYFYSSMLGGSKVCTNHFSRIETNDQT
jgi:hypothetical protein